MCTLQGTFAYSPTPNDNLCQQTPTINLYGTGTTVGTILSTDPSCAPGFEPATGYYCSSSVYFGYVGEGPGITGSTTPCLSAYCVYDTVVYDDTFNSVGTYDGYTYFIGNTSGNYIYYSTGNTLWCLSTSLGGACLQFGPLGSASPCPDLDDTLFTGGTCPSPTPVPIDPCTTFDFDALFDCGVTITPSDTPTPTPTPTPTLTPTQTNVCGGANFDVTATKFTPTPTTTSTPTPTPTTSINYSCSFSGTVTFNSMSEILKCGDSKQFRDCFSGYDYYTTQALVNENNEPLKEGYVYQSTINNVSVCVIFVGLVSNISGIDNVSIDTTIGPESAGSCLSCVPVASVTPTITPTNTPTPTPTLPCLCQNYSVIPNPSEGGFGITDCDTGLSRTLRPLNFGLLNWSVPVTVCSSTVPSTIGTVVNNGDCCVPISCNIWTTTNTAPIAVNFYYRNSSGTTITQTINPGQTLSFNSIVSPYQDSATLVFTNTGVSCPNFTPSPTPTPTKTPTPTPTKTKTPTPTPTKTVTPTPTKTPTPTPTPSSAFFFTGGTTFYFNSFQSCIAPFNTGGSWSTSTATPLVGQFLINTFTGLPESGQINKWIKIVPLFSPFSPEYSVQLDITGNIIDVIVCP